MKMCDFGISGYLVDSVAKTMDAGCKPYMAVSVLVWDRSWQPSAAFGLDSKSLLLRNQSCFTSVLRQKPLQSALGFLTQQSPPRTGLPSL